MSLTKTLAALALAAMVLGGAVAPSMAASGSTIAGIVLQQDQFFRTFQKGMEAAADAAGVKLMFGNSNSQPQQELRLVDTYIASGVNAIVVAPVSNVASVPALKRAKQAGIPIVTYNANIADTSIPVTYLNSNQGDLGASTGQMAARFVHDQLGGKAVVGLLGFRAQLPEISAARTNGFLEKAKQGNQINVVARQDAWIVDKAVQVAGDMITANPDMNVIFAANEGGTVGAVQAVRNAGKQGKIFVFGVDGTKQTVAALQADDNVLQGVTAQQPYMMGEMAVQAALAAVHGEKTDKTVTVPVLALSRTDPAAVTAFQHYLDQVS